MAWKLLIIIVEFTNNILLEVFIMITEQELLEILKAEVTPALGCTEPVAVALACAAAAGGKKDITGVEVVVSNNIYKNGMSVGIPGLKETGLDFAAALGAVGGDYTLGLQVLGSIKKDDVDKCHDLVNQNEVKVEAVENGERLYIEAKVKANSGDGRCIIKGSHSNIVLIERDGVVEFSKDYTKKASASNSSKLKGLNIKDLVELIDGMKYEDLKFMLDGAKMNKKAAELGLKERLGMAVGASMYDYVKEGILSDNINNMAKINTAAASDARMSGYFIPVMSSAGSGNHGLTAILPVVTAAEKLNSGDEKLAKALAISHTITIFIKNYTGRLSALCGCGVAAATGASAAVTYLLDGNEKHIESAINNMIANVSGMICDGAKPGCALKLSTAAGCAVDSALLAVKGVTTPSDNGILDATCEKTIENLGMVCDPGMVETDKVILDVMINKNIKRC